jgi:uncharacterized membrane protein
MIDQGLTWIDYASQAMLSNSRWMTWNTFLALVPLGLSFCLFKPSTFRWFPWVVCLLMGLTFFPNARIVAWFLPHLIPDLGMPYLLGALLFTAGLMIVDIWVIKRFAPFVRFAEPHSRSLTWWLGFLIFISFLPNAPYVLTDIIHLIDDIRDGYSVWIITLALIPLYLIFMIVGFQAYVFSLMHLGEYMQRQGWGKFIFPAEIIIHGLSAIAIYLGRFLRFNSWDIITNTHHLVNKVIEDLTAKRPVLVMVITFVVISALYWLMKWLTLGVQQLIHNQKLIIDN